MRCHKDRSTSPLLITRLKSLTALIIISMIVLKNQTTLDLTTTYTINHKISKSSNNKGRQLVMVARLWEFYLNMAPSINYYQRICKTIWKMEIIWKVHLTLTVTWPFKKNKIREAMEQLQQKVKVALKQHIHDRALRLINLSKQLVFVKINVNIG